MDNKYRITRRIWIFIICIIFAGPAACSVFKPDTESKKPGRAVSFSQIHKSLDQNRTAYVSKTLAVIEKQRDFAKLFKTLSADKKVPEIDFSEHMVLLAHMGTQKSTGYSIEITELTAFDHHIRARVVSRVPGRNCMTATALTHPYHLVRIPKTDKDILFSEKRIVHSCD